MQRYFIKNENVDLLNNMCYITGSDFHHIKNVMRMKLNNNIYVVDEDENAYLAEITCFDLDKVECNIIKKLENKVELDSFVVIAQGLVRREKTEEVLRRITELGASGYCQVAMERSIVKVKETKDSKTDRMKSIVKEACEQCHRNKLMEVYNVHTFKEFIKNFNDFDVKLFAYEEAGRQNVFNLKDKIKEAKNKKMVVLVGPEGGISENEVKLLEANGFISVGLGPRILRTETAPLYVMSAISYELEIGGCNE